MTTTNNKKRFLVALPASPGGKGFCHPTILVSGKDEADAISLVHHHTKHRKFRPNIGDIKEVDY